MARSNPAKVALWRKRLRDFPNSGLTVAQFCAQEGVSVPSFYQWRRKLNQHPDPTRESPPAFQPISVVPCGIITLLFPNGTWLEVPAADQQALHAVLHAVLNHHEHPVTGEPRC